MRFRHLNSIFEISSDQWNAICGIDYPFLRHEFLAALEASKSTTAARGWKPQHLVLEQNDKIIGLMPLFQKNHSYGEYVFDWAWADAYHQHGLDYYPKLVTAIPYTPATGPRLCWHTDLTEAEQIPATEAVCKHIPVLAKQLGASSWHYLFPQQAATQQLGEHGVLQRIGCQFHWFNRGYRDFDEFLGTFVSRKRKNLNRERRRVQEQGIQLAVVEGANISQFDWDSFYQFYHLTYFKRSGRQGYLSADFFPLISQSMPENLMMVTADHDGERVAAALYFKSSTHLYGRYWGCSKAFDALHFEACYYQGIEYAIAHGLQCFDPGAQGEHKIQRGFTPVFTYSNHWIAHPEFRRAIADFLQRDAAHTRAYQQEACSLLPFRTDNPVASATTITDSDNKPRQSQPQE